MMNVRDRKMREELNMHPVKNTHELWALADLCSLAEEGRLAPEDAARDATAGVTSAGTSSKKTSLRKRGLQQALAAEPGAPAGTEGRSKPSEEVAAARPATGKWCPVHESDDHDARNCRSVLGFAETRKRRFGEQGVGASFGNCYRCNQPGHQAKNCSAPPAQGAPNPGRGGGGGGGRGGDGGGGQGAQGGRGAGRGGGRGDAAPQPRGNDNHPGANQGGDGGYGPYPQVNDSRLTHLP